MNNGERFSIRLENEKAVTYRKLGLALAAVNFITFLLFLFLSNTWLAGSTGIAAILIYFIIKKIRARTKDLHQLVDGKLFYLLAIVWLQQNIFISLFVLLTGLLLHFSVQPFGFVFSAGGITRDFFPGKTYEWSEMDAVILKDGILTLDFKNNRLIQLPVENLSDTDVPAFNAFANTQIMKSLAGIK